MSTAPKNIHLAEPLFTQLADVACTQNTTPDELVNKVIEKFPLRSRLQRLSFCGERRSQALGLGLDDVDRLIHEHRQEQRNP